MRLQRLDLTRYGKFTDVRIDFGPPASGRPDLHIVYGPNEAGKSTAFSAFLDLLFGIGRSSDYAFLHPYQAMRIGGALDIDGTLRDLVRVKRDGNSLLDARDQPVGEAVVQGALGGIDREGYRHMFSLDDRTLEDGGKSILASKGDLGQLLFSASAGLADLGRGLDEVKAAADAFSRPHAKESELLRLKKRLAELKEEKDGIDTLASHYARLVEARDRAQGLYDGTVAARGQAEARRRTVDRLLNALPRQGALRRLRAQRAPLSDLPDMPPWAGEFARFRDVTIEAAARREGLVREVAALDAALSAEVVDEPGLAAADAVEALADLHARHRTAEKDLPDRRQRLRDLDRDIAHHLGRLGRADEAQPQRLVLTADVAGRLRALLEERSGRSTAAERAAAELATAHRTLDEAAAAMPAASLEVPGESAVAALGAVLATLRSSDGALRVTMADRAHQRALADLGDRLGALRPWSGDVAGLAAMPAPDAGALARWTATAAELGHRVETLAGDVERLSSERRRLDAERSAVAAVGVLGDRDAAEIRARRDTAWAAHRQALDGASADRFQAALRADDEAAAARLAGAAQLADMRGLERQAAALRAAHDHAAERLDTASGARRALDAEVEAAVARASPDLGGMDLPAFEAWCGKRDLALAAARQARDTERDLRDAEADRATARRTLVSAMAGTGVAADPHADIPGLVAAAEGAVETARTLKASRETLAGRQRDVADRARDAQNAAAALQRWDEDWAAACAACWLGEAKPMPTPGGVREILSVLDDLAPLLRDRAQLVDRVDKMEADQAQYRAGIVEIASALGMATEGGTSDLAAAIDRRIADARGARDRRAADSRKRDDARARQEALAIEGDAHAGRAAAMTGYFGVETLDAVATKLAALDTRASLDRQVEEAEADILAALDAADLPAAEVTLGDADKDALETERDALDEQVEHLGGRCQELYAAATKAVDAVEAIGGDDRVAAIEVRRRTTLLEIEEGASRYLKLRAGALAAEHALRLYRDRHRSGMMDEASRAFRTITRGAYSGLTTQPGKDAEVLVAVSAEGGSKMAAQLSKGTCFQLYLALRVAGYREFARARRPVPFVADDIMETFDDDRAEEAFKLFADMAEVGQVIYLTHHAHLCGIAKKVCPDIRIHDLTQSVA